MAKLAPVLLSEFRFRNADFETADLSQGLSALPRGGISEILGEASSGRTAIAQGMLGTATRGGEVCAWVDLSNSFDPVTASGSGADLSKMLWVKCGHRLEAALKSADMILHSGGFGLVVLDLCDVQAAGLNRVPLSYWYRLRNAIEHTPSVLLVLGRDAIAKSCAVRQFSLDAKQIEWRGRPPFQIMTNIETSALLRKPMTPEPVTLEMRAEYGEVSV